MGRPVARRLREAGWDARGWNRSPLPPDVTAGVPLVASLAEAARAEVCLLLAADSAAVDAVLAALRPHLRAGQLVIDMATSDVDRGWGDPNQSVVHRLLWE